jgi:hypothetical protein
MPYNDPHTAGPALWALKQLEDCEYEASVAVQPRSEVRTVLTASEKPNIIEK